jgi:Vitamin B12 dependent methionine synthase, activation domain
MRRVMRLSAGEIRPEARDVLRRQGLPYSAIVSPRMNGLVEEAAGAFDELASPAAIVEQISLSDFGVIYAGAGQNDPDTPLADIYPRAGTLALFAATLGQEVDMAIRRRFRAHDVALGCMLDAFASAAAERLADRVASHYRATLAEGPAASTIRVLPYSPGYCGWHVSGQETLFARLRPEEIGIELSERCMMQPIKSVSGVLTAGPADVHLFRPTYDCCELCATQHCRERMRSVRARR